MAIFQKTWNRPVGYKNIDTKKNKFIRTCINPQAINFISNFYLTCVCIIS